MAGLTRFVTRSGKKPEQTKGACLKTGRDQVEDSEATESEGDDDEPEPAVEVVPIYYGNDAEANAGEAVEDDDEWHDSLDSVDMTDDLSEDEDAHSSGAPACQSTGGDVTEGESMDDGGEAAPTKDQTGPDEG